MRQLEPDSRAPGTPYGVLRCGARALVVLALWLALPGTAAALEVAPAEGVAISRQTITVELREREYLLMRPRAAGNDVAPLVVMLHFLNGLSGEMANLAGAAALVRETGAWVALPQASRGRWNNGTILGTKLVDDVAFLEALLDALMAEYPIDPQQVLMTGYSNGAAMAEHFACQRPDRVTAIGLVASTLFETRIPACDPRQPVSYALVHGTDDNIVPYNGNATRLSAPASAAFWAERAGCQPEPERSELPDAVADGTRVVIDRYRECDSAEVELFTVKNGGHTYPGTLGFSPDLGRVSQDINATFRLFDFLQRAAEAGQ